ncbi:hypothetical protein [Nocardia asteroides]|uniref:hypothetical protein n=1 Tax=Nocardia asteroides TaxID=1824 RepID=UPI0033FD0E0D
MPIPDLRPEDGRKLTDPVTLGRWLQTRATVEVSVTDDEYAGPTDIAPARHAVDHHDGNLFAPTQTRFHGGPMSRRRVAHPPDASRKTMEGSTTCAIPLSGSPFTSGSTSSRRRDQLKCREGQVIARRLPIVLPEIDHARHAGLCHRAATSISRRITAVVEVGSRVRAALCRSLYSGIEAATCAILNAGGLTTPEMVGTVVIHVEWRAAPGAAA